MNKLTDQKHLVTAQYKNQERLAARLRLHERFHTNPVVWHRWVFDQVILPSQASILEIGCGNGALWLRNQDRIPPGWNLLLGDLSYGMLQEAKQNLAFLGGQARFQSLDVQLLRLPNEAFDVVIANHILYHVPSVRRALLEIERVLKPGGRLYAATNGKTHLQELFALGQSVPQLRPYLLDIQQVLLAPDSFTLETGLRQLGEFFREISLSNYPDNLVVTEPAPFVDYLLSLLPELSDNEVETAGRELLQLAGNHIAAGNGRFVIHKSTGMFTAVASPAAIRVD
jgi:SAM-dependent methyltransferase